MLSMHFCQIQLSKISFVKMQKKMNLQFDLEEVVGASAVSAEVLKGACLEADLQLICHFLFQELLVKYVKCYGKGGGSCLFSVML